MINSPFLIQHIATISSLINLFNFGINLMSDTKILWELAIIAPLVDFILHPFEFTQPLVLFFFFSLLQIEMIFIIDLYSQPFVLFLQTLKYLFIISGHVQYIFSITDI